MSYYAIAVGRESKITESYLECKKLTQGYSGAKFKKFYYYDEAEEYIRKHQNEMENKTGFKFEEEFNLITSYSSKSSMIKTDKTELYISYGVRDLKGKAMNPLTNKYEDTVLTSEFQFRALISTVNQLPLTECTSNMVTYGDQKLNNYEILERHRLHNSIDMVSVIYNTKGILEFLYNKGITSVSLTTDSHYLIYLMKDNVFNTSYIFSMDLDIRIAYEELYAVMGMFNTIFLTYKTGRDMPNKLAYISNMYLEGTDE